MDMELIMLYTLSDIILFVELNVDILCLWKPIVFKAREM